MEQTGIVQLDGINHGEYYLAQLAVADELSVPFFVHKSIRERYPKEEDFFSYLVRMAKATIARCGDARNPFSTELVEGRT